jgi:carboxymethylenebutenolidase
MHELELDIQTSDGAMNTFVVYPDRDGPYPLVLFLMDAPGKRPELEKMASRLATSGYCVALPNLYYRKSRQVNFQSRDDMVEHMDSLNSTIVIDDCMALVNWADQQSFVQSGPAGVVGYCMSGPFAFSLCGEVSDRFVAGGSFHGVRLMTEATDSPHLTASNIKGSFHVGCAESDHWAPVEMINQLEGYVSEHAPKVEVEWYPGTEHGFVFPDRAGKYHHEAAERHWHRLLSLFRQHLKD